MYEIVYTRTATKDIPKLKGAHLDGKAAVLPERPGNVPARRASYGAASRTGLMGSFILVPSGRR